MAGTEVVGLIDGVELLDLLVCEVDDLEIGCDRNPNEHDDRTERQQIYGPSIRELVTDLGRTRGTFELRFLHGNTKNTNRRHQVGWPGGKSVYLQDGRCACRQSS